MQIVRRSNIESRRFYLKPEVSADTSLTLLFSLKQYYTKYKWPFFRVSVLLSLELDSKFVGTAFFFPFTVVILQRIRENIFTSISLLKKVFSSSHPNPW